MYDEAYNPHIVDVNTGSSFYHAETGQEWPQWFRDERSAMVRSAVDIVQEIAFRKRAKRWAILHHQKPDLPGEPPGLAQLGARGSGGWTLVYDEQNTVGNRSVSERTRGLEKSASRFVPGQCAMKEAEARRRVRVPGSKSRRLA